MPESETEPEDYLAEARRLIYQRFCDDLARQYPGTIWRIEDVPPEPEEKS